jgi:hypothetical protein
MSAKVVKGTGGTSEPDPFDLVSLRDDPGPEVVHTTKPLVHVPVRKPGPTEFFRVHPSPEFTVDGWTVEYGSDKDLKDYWIAPHLVNAVRYLPLRRKKFWTCVNRWGVVFLWPSPIPSEGASQGMTWYQSRLRAAHEATRLWCRINGNMSLGAYELTIAPGDLGDPDWPDYSFPELLKLGFKDAVITSIDHQVIKELSGEA